MSKRKGIALIVLIIILAFVAISILGITLYISNSIALTNMRILEEKALFAAQAGAQKAIADYLANGFLATSTVLNLTPTGDIRAEVNNKLANALLVDSTNMIIFKKQVFDIPLDEFIYPGLTNIFIINISDRAMRIYFAGCTGTRYGAFPRFKFVGKEVETYYTSYGSKSYDYPVTTLSAGERCEIQMELTEYSLPMYLYFGFLDASDNPESGRAVCILNGNRSGSEEFYITSTGIVGKGKIMSKRSIEATYDVITNEITRITKGGNEI